MVAVDPRAQEWREKIRDDRFFAHTILFPHRHEYPFADFHQAFIEDFWSGEWRYIDLGFRECGKTTLVEEAIVIAACERSFRNCVVVGAKEALAAELLTNIKVELELNEKILEIYGELRGTEWSKTRITLTHGACIQVLGREQSVRGTKHLNWRPDLVVVNDFEDDDDLLTPEGRRRSLRWFLQILLPACDRRRRRVRIYDTVRDAESVPMMLITRHNWPSRRVPISYLDEAGVVQPSWPGHPTLTRQWLETEKAMYTSLGESDIWDREFMMDTSASASRDFKPEYFRVEPLVRTWEPVWAVFDPARTKGPNSASTGIVVFSWVGQKLVVWEDRTGFYLPSEMIEIMFELEERYQPVAIGFEKNGLEEWALTLIRGESLKRGIFLPLQPISAPRDKMSFIRGLEAYARLGQIILAQECSTLVEQFTGFPRGRIDGPNALAYAQELRPGLPVYGSFRSDHIQLGLSLSTWQPVFLVCNARDGWTTAALCQFSQDRVAILADWACVGTPEEHIPNIATEAALRGSSYEMTTPEIPRGWEALKVLDMAPIQTRRETVYTCPDWHWDRWLNVGLVQALNRVPARPIKGAPLAAGREWLQERLSRWRHGEAAIRVSDKATWTLRAFAGGYCRDKKAMDAEPGPYRCLMEGIEAWCGLMNLGFGEEEATEPNYSYDRQGRAYVSMIPARH
jgi:hypothetical protein